MIGQSLKNLVLIAGCCALGAALATAADSPRRGPKSIVFQGSQTHHAPRAKVNCFAIMGQVARPGAYEIDHAHPEMLELIRAAGGLTDGASGALRVIRQGRPGLQAFYSPKLQYELLPGDLIVADRAGNGTGGAKHVELGQIQSSSATGGVPSRTADAVQVGLVQLADYPLVMHVPSDQPTLRNVLLRLRQTLPADVTVSVIKAGGRPEAVSAGAAGGFELASNTVLVFDRKTIDLAALPELPQPVRVSPEGEAQLPVSHAPASPLPVQTPARGLQGIPVVHPGVPGGPMLSPTSQPLASGGTETALTAQPALSDIAQAPPAVPVPDAEPAAAAPSKDSVPGFDESDGESTSAPPPPVTSRGIEPVASPKDPLESGAAASPAVANRRAANASGAADRFDAAEPEAVGEISSAELGVESSVFEPPTGSSPVTVFLIAAGLFGTVLLVIWNVNRPRTPMRSAPTPQPAARAPRRPAPIAAVALPEPPPAPVTDIPAAPQKKRSLVPDVNPLDAIIENRLSIDVEPLTLPSELPIYGRPVSEPSFRVDAGHEPGAPHFGAGRLSPAQSTPRRAQRGRTERTVITVRESAENLQAAGPVMRTTERPEERTQAVTPPSRREPPAPKGEASPPQEIGLLDRVLTALHEQKP